MRGVDRRTLDLVERENVDLWKQEGQNQPNRNGFEGRDGQVAEGQKPPDDEGLGGAVGLVGVGHLSAGHRKHRSDLGVAEPDDQHERAAGSER